MNVSAETRLKMVLLNLDRMRKESPDMQDRFVFVNVPSTELRVIEDGRTTYHANAIVGRVARKTPLLKSEIFQAKLNPDWSVPAKIAAIDMLKHELEEPGYFASKNVRVFTSDGRQVDPAGLAVGRAIVQGDDDGDGGAAEGTGTVTVLTGSALIGGLANSMDVRGRVTDEITGEPKKDARIIHGSLMLGVVLFWPQLEAHALAVALALLVSVVLTIAVPALLLRAMSKGQ